MGTMSVDTDFFGREYDENRFDYVSRKYAAKVHPTADDYAR